MSVFIVGNPTTPRESIVAPRKNNVEPVVKKSALTSWKPIVEASKLLNVVNNVIATFSETLVSKHIWLLIMLANPPPVLKPPSAFSDVDVPPVVNRT